MTKVHCVMSSDFHRLVNSQKQKARFPKPEHPQTSTLQPAYNKHTGVLKITLKVSERQEENHDLLISPLTLIHWKH